MVAMFIGLVGILVIFEVFSASEGYRRTTTSGSDAQQNGALALFTIQHELQQAGYGFNTSQAMGCTLLAYDSTQGVIPVYTLVPVRISAGPADGSDTIEVNYGNQVLVVTPVNIYQNMIASTDA
jgi:type IV pilus assembly protein PilW